jgi:AmiR/NasT family two-component response regulator
VKTPIRILMVDDYEPWRRFEREMFLAHEELQIVGECSDGIQSVQQAEELQPDDFIGYKPSHIERD